MLSTSFCGVNFRNPIVIASCPATETINGIKKCYEHGAGAVILKSMADYKYNEFVKIPRRTYVDKKGLWVTSSFSREVLNQDEGLMLLDKSVRLKNMPIIASVAGLTYELENWIPLCKEVENLGADMIQLDLFYMGQPISDENNFKKLLVLLSNLASEIKIPVIPKLNIEIPAYLAAKHFVDINMQGISLLDSVRVNSPISIESKNDICYNFINRPGMSSVVGSWQMPITQHYLYIMSKHTNYEICAGGGLTNARDAIEMIMLGAKTVQFCTAILQNGHEYIRCIIDNLEKILIQYGYNSIEEIYCKSLGAGYTDIQDCCTTYEDMYAEINNNCINCKKCLKNGWCEAIKCQGNKMVIVQDKCEGCGFCLSLCKNQAIEIKKRKQE